MRAFIAIEVPYFKSIEKLQSAIEGKFKAVEPENIHLTLKFLGEIREGDVDKIASFVGSCKPEKFTMRLKGIGFFPNENYIKVVWIGVEDGKIVSDVMKCIDSRLTTMGFKKERSYVPHITVARVKGRIDMDKLQPFKNMVFGDVDVDKIKIKKSTLTQDGPIYEDVAVISL